MWNAPNQNPHNNQPQQPPQPHEAAKWGPQPVKEEPKNNIPLPEILENSSGSPHVSFVDKRYTKRKIDKF